MRVLVNIAALVAVLYLGLLVTLFFAQRNLIYLRSAPPVDPATVGLSNVEVVALPTSDGETLVAWWSPPQPGKPTVLFLHGNAGTVADRSEAFAFYQGMGLGAMFPEYRGYGGSTGTPSEKGLIADAIAAYDWLLSKGVSPDKIGVVGESIGSGPAVALATTKPVSALALEAPFTSMVDVIAHHYPWLPVRLLLRDRWESERRIAALSVPLLVIHGTADSVVPYALGVRLYDAAPGKKRMITAEGADHGDLFGQRYWAEAAELFETGDPNRPPTD
jgi:fermentation-respiration switch protein FrsA (DUF1100 family)